MYVGLRKFRFQFKMHTLCHQAVQNAYVVSCTCAVAVVVVVVGVVVMELSAHSVLSFSQSNTLIITTHKRLATDIIPTGHALDDVSRGLTASLTHALKQ